MYNTQSSAYLLHLLEQYHQILFPTLTLCISIINSMGPDNVDAKSQVSRFVLSHVDTFLHILTNKIGNIKMLEELKLTTCLISKLAPFGWFYYEFFSCFLFFIFFFL
jgi:hypothetical protein